VRGFSPPTLSLGEDKNAEASLCPRCHALGSGSQGWQVIVEEYKNKRDSDLGFYRKYIASIKYMFSRHHTNDQS
jgi:hypothetical protein